jgi:hypothetical protein
MCALWWTMKKDNLEYILPWNSSSCCWCHASALLSNVRYRFLHFLCES